MEHTGTSGDMPWVQGPVEAVPTPLTKLSQVDRAPIRMQEQRVRCLRKGFCQKQGYPWTTRSMRLLLKCQPLLIWYVSPDREPKQHQRLFCAKCNRNSSEKKKTVLSPGGSQFNEKLHANDKQAGRKERMRKPG